MSHANSPSEPGLKRNVTGILLYVFILGDVLGAGIYALVGKISGEVGGATWLPMLVALVLALLTATSYAELVTKYPKAGGSAVFAERAFKSPTVSYLVGFAMLAAGVVSAAGLSVAFSGEYLTQFVDVNPLITTQIFLVLLGVLNARGIKESLRTNLIMTAVELSGLVLVVVTVGILLSRGGGDLGRAVEINSLEHPVSAVLGASLLAYYSFVGFETSANIAEEIRRPSVVYPRALFGAMLTAGVMYILVGLAATTAVDPSALGESTAPLAAVLTATGVNVPGWLFGAIALVAIANGALLTMIMSSRLAYGMARQGLLPSPLGRVLPKRGTPGVAILVTTVLAMGLTLTGEVDVLAETVVILLLVVFLSTNVAVLVLRRERVDHKHFRAFTVIPVLGALSCVLLLAQQDGQIWLRGGIILAVGLIVHLVLRRRSRGALQQAEDGGEPDERTGGGVPSAAQGEEDGGVRVRPETSARPSTESGADHD